MSLDYEIRKGIINESSLIGIQPPLNNEQLVLVNSALSKVIDARISYGNIAFGLKIEDGIYTQIHISSDSQPGTYIDDAAHAVENVLTEQREDVRVDPEIIRFVGRAGLLFQS